MPRGPPHARRSSQVVESRGICVDELRCVASRRPSPRRAKCTSRHAEALQLARCRRPTRPSRPRRFRVRAACACGRGCWGRCPGCGRRPRGWGSGAGSGGCARPRAARGSPARRRRSSRPRRRPGRDAPAMMRPGRSPASSAGPVAKIAARSMALRSSRRLPGQAYRRRASRASGVKPSIRLPICRAKKARRCSARARRSDRSRSGGSASSTTLRRKSRSSRNWPAATAASRSRLVAATRRTSAVRGRASPTRSYRRSWRKRSSLGWSGAAGRRSRRGTASPPPPRRPCPRCRRRRR